MAAAFAHGLDGWKLLTTTDPFERALLGELTRKTVEIRDQLDDRLAVKIINTLGEALSGKRKRGG